MSEKLEYKFPAPYFPDWDKVGKEYNWRAFDARGHLFYYNSQPRQQNLIMWINNASCIQYGKACEKWAQKIWRDSLEKRPE